MTQNSYMNNLNQLLLLLVRHFDGLFLWFFILTPKSSFEFIPQDKKDGAVTKPPLTRSGEGVGGEVTKK